MGSPVSFHSLSARCTSSHLRLAHCLTSPLFRPVRTNTSKSQVFRIHFTKKKIFNFMQPGEGGKCRNGVRWSWSHSSAIRRDQDYWFRAHIFLYFTVYYYYSFMRSVSKWRCTVYAVYALPYLVWRKKKKNKAAALLAGSIFNAHTHRLRSNNRKIEENTHTHITHKLWRYERNGIYEKVVDRVEINW